MIVLKLLKLVVILSEWKGWNVFMCWYGSHCLTSKVTSLKLMVKCIIYKENFKLIYKTKRLPRLTLATRSKPL